MHVSLRAVEAPDLELLDGADAPFLDFGPRAPRTKVPPAGLDDSGALAVAELLFRHTPINRVEAHTDIENVAEQRALEAAGFHREGLIRGAQWRDGAYRDGYLYAVTRPDMREN